MATDVLCDRQGCEHNQDQQCTARQIGISGRMCITIRNAKRDDDYRDMMRTPLPVGRKESVNAAKVTGTIK